jgi:hypothetical protein
MDSKEAVSSIDLMEGFSRLVNLHKEFGGLDELVRSAIGVKTLSGKRLIQAVQNSSERYVKQLVRSAIKDNDFFDAFILAQKSSLHDYTSLIPALSQEQISVEKDNFFNIFFDIWTSGVQSYKRNVITQYFLNFMTSQNQTVYQHEFSPIGRVDFDLGPNIKIFFGSEKYFAIGVCAMYFDADSKKIILDGKENAYVRISGDPNSVPVRRFVFDEEHGFPSVDDVFPVKTSYFFGSSPFMVVNDSIALFSSQESTGLMRGDYVKECLKPTNASLLWDYSEQDSLSSAGAFFLKSVDSSLREIVKYDPLFEGDVSE